MKYYFTFGFGQPHEGCYHIIEADSKEAARRKMFKRFGLNWAFQYNNAEKAGVEKYKLKEIK